MKSGILILFIVVLPIMLLGQKTKDWSAFNQRINATPYEGRRFKLQAAVKVEMIDSSAQAEIWARVDKIDMQAGSYYNMRDKPIKKNNWMVYTLEGKIDEKGEYLTFGGLCFRRGFSILTNLNFSSKVLRTNSKNFKFPMETLKIRV